MIKYARRKKKKDLFVLWLGLSTMCFGVGGATLRGVKAVSVAPVLYDAQPQHIEVSLVSIPDGIGGGSEIDNLTETVEPPVAALPEPEAPAPLPEVAGDPRPPFEPEPLELPLPEPLAGDGIADAEQPPSELPKETTAPEAEPAPEPVDTPPEPAPDPPQPEAGEVEAKPEKKVEAKPPPPEPEKATSRPSTPKPKATPPKPAPKPAPKASPATRDPKVAVTKPKILYRPNLRFPEQAQRAGIGGSLLLEVRVDTNGRPTRIKVVRSSGHRILDNEAIAALRQWRFDPARNVFGKPVANTIRVPVNFGYGR